MCSVYGNDIAERLVSSGAARDCRDMSHGIYTLLEQEGRTQRNEKKPTFLLPPECGN
jgi:endonuclease YncB( thermonuclease family)